jgi:hypothetical protein
MVFLTGLSVGRANQMIPIVGPDFSHRIDRFGEFPARFLS